MKPPRNTKALRARALSMKKCFLWDGYRFEECRPTENDIKGNGMQVSDYTTKDGYAEICISNQYGYGYTFTDADDVWLERAHKFR